MGCGVCWPRRQAAPPLGDALPRLVAAAGAGCGAELAEAAVGSLGATLLGMLLEPTDVQPMEVDTSLGSADTGRPCAPPPAALQLCSLIVQCCTAASAPSR